MNSDLINIFERIRDEPLNNPEMLGDKDNRCWGKHRRLKEILEKAGYSVRFRVCSFNWSNQRFPKSVLNLARLDEDYHLYLEIKINGSWRILDCSNDCNLPDYNSWDGINDCKIAVNYNKIFSPEASLILEKNEPLKFSEIFSQNKNLYISLNLFLDKLRKIQH